MEMEMDEKIRWERFEVKDGKGKRDGMSSDSEDSEDSDDEELERELEKELERINVESIEATEEFALWRMNLMENIESNSLLSDLDSM